MKKLFLLFALAFAANMLFAQLHVSTTPSNKNVIMEEFTGRGCQYCPLGHLYGNQYAASNPGRFWAINIHAGYYLQTSYPNFGTTDGTTLLSGFNVSGYPAGALNRSHGSGNGTMTPSSNAWFGTANAILAQSSPVNLAGIAMIDESTRKLTIFVEAYYTADASSATNYLTIALLQSNILGSQSGGQQYNPEQMINGQYNHTHILRDVITPTWGDPVTPTTQGSLYQNVYQYDLPEVIGSPNGVEVVFDDLELLVWITDGEKYFVHTAAAIEITEPEDFPDFPEITAGQEEGTLNVNISWTAPDLSKGTKALDGFNIYRDGVKLNSSLLPASQTTYADEAPAFGYSYCYKIVPVVNGADSYPNTDCIFMDIDLPPATEVVARQLEIGKKDMLITWTKPAVDFDVEGYNLFRNNIKINSEIITETSFNNTGLSFREYCFVVEAIQGSIIAEKSEDGCVELIENAAAPGNLKAKQTAISELTINLTWDAASGAEGYHIYRDGEKINDEAVTGMTYQDEVAEFNVEYCYTAKGVFSGTPGPESNKACETAYDRIIPAVTGVSAEQNGENIKEIKIVWDAVTEGTVDGYNIYRAGEKINSALLSETSYVDNTIEFDIEYCYTVAVVIEGIEGPKSDEACATAIYDISITSNDLETAINIYPNPVTDKLHLDTELNVTEYQVFDIQGRLIYSSKTGEKEIPAKEWASGVYIMKITTDKGIVNKRFVKQ